MSYQLLNRKHEMFLNYIRQLGVYQYGKLNRKHEMFLNNYNQLQL